MGALYKCDSCGKIFDPLEGERVFVGRGGFYTLGKVELNIWHGAPRCVAFSFSIPDAGALCPPCVLEFAERAIEKFAKLHALR